MNIVIVGAVAGGMSAAARLRRKLEDANIIVLDRGKHASFANCGLPYFVGGEIESEDSLIVQSPENLAAWLNLDVRLEHDVVAVDPKRKVVEACHNGEILQFQYDELILSPGAKAFVPPIPGIDHPAVTTLRTVDDAVQLRSAVDAGAKTAVVIGGGFIGVEAAEVLAHAGLEVSIVEAGNHIFPLLDTEIAHVATRGLTELGVSVLNETQVSAIHAAPEGTDVHVEVGGQSIQADLVLLAAGVRPDTKVFDSIGLEMDRGAIIVDEHGATNLENIWAVGDATLSRREFDGQHQVVALAGPANRAGRLVADAIAGEGRSIPRALGTSVVRVGAMTVASTGMNAQGLKLAGKQHHTIHLHPNQHAGYFPGATQIHLSVHFDTHGRILGAQAVGKDGVEKRIDVLSTAIRGGLGIEDLIDLDLCYAPPYGSAKDPVNFAGMMGENVLSGQLKLWYPWELSGEDALLLDVRTPAESAKGMLPGAINIPHTEVRSRIPEIKQLAGGRPIRVYCQSGVRSYIAHRVLASQGLPSASLSGGWLTLQAWFGPKLEELLKH